MRTPALGGAAICSSRRRALEDFQRILELETRLHREGRHIGAGPSEEALELLDEVTLDVGCHGEEEADEVIDVLRGRLRVSQASRLLQIVQHDADHGVHRLHRNELLVEELADDHGLAALLLLELGPLNDGLLPASLRRRGDHNNIGGVLERIKHLDLSLNVLLHLGDDLNNLGNELCDDRSEEALLDTAVKQQGADAEAEHVVARREDLERLLEILLQVDLGELVDGRNDRLVIRIVLLTDLAMRIFESLLAPVVREAGRRLFAIVLLGLHVCSRANLGDRSAAHTCDHLEACRGKGHLGPRTGGVDSCDLHDAHNPYIRLRKDSFS